MLLPFIPGQVYNRRSDIHQRFGGSWQSGISVPKDFPYIFIFTGKSGHQHGYHDRWDNANVFSYTGEGQVGDMQFTRGNLALRESINSGRRIFLFESEGKGAVKFVSEVEFHDADYFPTHDRDGNQRIAIKFFLKRTGAIIPKASLLIGETIAAENPVAYGATLRPNLTERTGLVTSRVGQGAYRKRIIYRWEYQCAVTGFRELDVLIASHIVPWANASDDERLDVHNGILLSPTYDALFDKHLISFEKSGAIILSDKIETQAFHRIGVTGKERIQDFSQGNLDYLLRHQETFFNVK
jgi:5-methylcytosine-specific restriction protein A